MGDRKVEAAAKRIAYRLDPYGFVQRTSAAEKDRYVSVRPAPDAMARLTALLPVAQGVAAYAALARAADTSTASGDARGRGQVMADTLVERLTGQAQATEVPIEVQLVMTDQTLFSYGAKDEPAEVVGYGPVPAGLARRLALEGKEAPVWLRRLFTAPGSGQLIAMESSRRFYSPPQRRFVYVRDQRCRTPWCDAPIRQIDHVAAADDGGPTSVDNGQGYCQACNLAKQAPGWDARVIDSPAGPHEVEVTTPTGHRYRSRAPDPPGRAA
jgi:hypothetical protein